MVNKDIVDIYRVDWPSHHNCTENRDQEISCINISKHAVSTAVDISVCTSIEDIGAATSEDAGLKMLKAHITRGWPWNKDELEPNLGGYWPLRHDLAMIIGVTMKDKWIIILFMVQKQILDQLHSIHMGTDKTSIFVR